MTPRRSYAPPAKYADLPTPLVITPLPLLPCRQPPPGKPPALPSRPPLKPANDGWTRTKCIIPAAYPRRFYRGQDKLSRESHPYGPAPEKGETKDERNIRTLKEVKGLLERRFETEDRTRRALKEIEAVREEDEEQIPYWLAAERWRRAKQDEDGLTLVVNHANGMHKEGWHPTLRRLLRHDFTQAQFGHTSASSSTASSSNIKCPQINEIWLLDNINHGESVDLNSGHLGGLYNWEDGGRDVINLIEHVLPEAGELTQEGQVLAWHERPNGKRKRKIIGLGHSFGANALVQAAHSRADLFDALILVEPMCVPAKMPRSDLDSPQKPFALALGALKRRTNWPSLKAASEAFLMSPFYASWHPEVFELYKTHGLVRLPGGQNGENCGVQLATPAWCEASVFAEPNARGVAWDKLRELQIPVGSIMAENSQQTWGEEVSREMVWRPKYGSNEIIPGSNHLVVQEKPDEVADAIRRYLGNLALGNRLPHAKL